MTDSPQHPRPDDADFRAFVEHDDVDALARFFDAAGPRLLLLAAHVAPPGVDPEDLVQQTFLEALRARDTQAAGKSAIGWLTTILRNRAIDEHRRGGRRPETPWTEEVDAVDPERGPLERLSNDEAFDAVVEAIDALASPQREVVNLRLVHGMTPSAIAHTLGREPSTVRTQLERGLAKLRERVATRVSPFAIALLTALAMSERPGLAAVRETVLAEATSLVTTGVPVGFEVEPATIATTTSTGAIGTGAWIAAAALVLGTLVTYFAPWSDGAAGVDPLPSVANSNGSTDVDGDEVATSAGASDVATDGSNDRRVAMADVEAGAADDRTAARRTADPEAAATPLVIGALFDHDGTPVADAEVRFGIDDFRWAHTIESTTRSAPDGSFALTLDDPEAPGSLGSAERHRGHEPFLTISIAHAGRPDIELAVPLEDFGPAGEDYGSPNGAPNGAPSDAPSGAPADRAPLDLGPLVYPPLRSVSLSIVDPNGEPVTWLEGESVFAMSAWTALAAYDPGIGGSELAAAPIDALGRCRFDAAPVGTLELHIDDGASQRHEAFSVLADGANDLRMVWPHPDPATMVRVSTWIDAIGWSIDRDATTQARLVLEDGGERRAALRTGLWSDVVFRDVPLGFHRIEIDVPGLEPLRVDGVVAGSTQELTLRGAAAVTLLVLDERGERRDDYRLSVSPFSVTVARAESELDELCDRRDASGDHFDSVAASDQTWTVHLPDGRERSVELTGLRAGEERLVEVRFGALRRITGRVVDADGAPLAGVSVEAMAGGDHPFADGTPHSFLADSFTFETNATATTDGEGRFALEVDGEQSHDLVAFRSAWCYATRTDAVAGDDVDLVLPASRRVEGRVTGLSRDVLESIQLHALGASRPPLVEPCTFLDAGRPTVVVRSGIVLSPNGRFVIEHAPTDGFELSVVYPREFGALFVGAAAPAGSPVHEVTTNRVAPLVFATVEAGGTDLTDLEVDASGVAPASVIVDVRFDGEPLPNGSLLMTKHLGANSGEAATQLGDRGRCTLEWLAPGTWSFGALTPNLPGSLSSATPSGPWIVKGQDRYDLAPGTTTEILVDVVPTPGRVRFVDADGRPLAGRTVQLEARYGHWSASEWRVCDADGYLDLSLPPGTWGVQLVDTTRRGSSSMLGRSSTLEWTVSGPVQETVRLEEPR